MTNSNPENPADTPEPAAAAPAAPAPVPNPGLDARRRLRELLSVPERDRSDEQWDEIIELEIQLAPGNRISGNEAPLGGGGQSRGQHNQGKPGGGQKKHRQRTGGQQQQRRPRQNKPQGGGGQPA